MAIVAIEGYDYYDPSETGGTSLFSRWILSSGSNSYFTVVPGRYTDGQAMQMGVGSGELDLPLAVASSTFTLGFALKLSSVGAGNVNFLSFGHYNASAFHDQLDMLFDFTNNRWRFQRGGVFVAESDVIAFDLETWVFIELEITVNGTVGTIRAVLDGEEILLATGLNTSSYGTTSLVDRIRFVSRASVTAQIDDLYVTNTLGAVGPTRVVMIYPDSDTAQKDFTNSSEDGTNYNKLNSLTADSDDYILGSITGTKDMYGMSNLPYNPVSIHAIQPVMSARKDTMNPKSIQINVDSGGTVVAGAAQDLAESTTDFDLHFDTILEEDPNTTEAWTTDAVNAIKMGPEIL